LPFGFVLAFNDKGQFDATFDGMRQVIAQMANTMAAKVTNTMRVRAPSIRSYKTWSSRRTGYLSFSRSGPDNLGNRSTVTGQVSDRDHHRGDLCPSRSSLFQKRVRKDPGASRFSKPGGGALD